MSKTTDLLNRLTDAAFEWECNGTCDELAYVEVTWGEMHELSKLLNDAHREILRLNDLAKHAYEEGK